MSMPTALSVFTSCVGGYFSCGSERVCSMWICVHGWRSQFISFYHFFKALWETRWKSVIIMFIIIIPEEHREILIFSCRDPGRLTLFLFCLLQLTPSTKLRFQRLSQWNWPTMATSSGITMTVRTAVQTSPSRRGRKFRLAVAEGRTTCDWVADALRPRWNLAAITTWTTSPSILSTWKPACSRRR